MRKCRCPFNWLDLRLALELTQPALCELLDCSRQTLTNAESVTRHRCPNRQMVKLMRIWLQEPEFQDRLRHNGFKHPWPEDVDARQQTAARR